MTHGFELAAIPYNSTSAGQELVLSNNQRREALNRLTKAACRKSVIGTLDRGAETPNCDQI